jgi:hypothetical protein
LLRVDADADGQLDAIRRLREQTNICSRVVVLRAHPAVKAAVDVWGDAGSRSHLHAAVKAALDPAGILNAGRGPL